MEERIMVEREDYDFAGRKDGRGKGKGRTRKQ